MDKEGRDQEQQETDEEEEQEHRDKENECQEPSDRKPASIVAHGDGGGQEHDGGDRQEPSEGQVTTGVALPAKQGGGSEQGDGGGHEARDGRKEHLERNKFKTKTDKLKSYKMTKITDYVQGKQAKNIKKQRRMEERRQEGRCKKAEKLQVVGENLVL